MFCSCGNAHIIDPVAAHVDGLSTDRVFNLDFKLKTDDDIDSRSKRLIRLFTFFLRSNDVVIC